MTNKEKATLLRSAASALEHGRIHTANSKLHQVFQASELYDLLTCDIYTDAYEYSSRVTRIRDLLANPNYYGTWTNTTECDCGADQVETYNASHFAWCASLQPEED